MAVDDYTSDEVQKQRPRVPPSTARVGIDAFQPYARLPEQPVAPVNPTRAALAGIPAGPVLPPSVPPAAVPPPVAGSALVTTPNFVMGSNGNLPPYPGLRAGIEGFQPASPAIPPSPAGAPVTAASIEAGRPAGPKLPFYDRPLNQPAMDAAKATGRVVQRIAAPLMKVAGPLATAGVVAGETYRTADDVTTPGMTGIDQVGRVGEGIARAAGTTAGAIKGAAGGAALGALGGPFAPITVPAGALIGGALGGYAGYKAPDIANGIANVGTGVGNYLAGRGYQPGDNQLPSARAAELQAQQRPAPVVAAPVVQRGRPTAPDVRDLRNAAPARPARAPTQRPTGAVPTAPVAAPAGIDEGLQAVYTNAPNKVSALPGSNVQVVGPGERFSPTTAQAVPDSISNAGIAGYAKAKEQGALDALSPVDARTRMEQAVQGTKNIGEIGAAAQHAGGAIGAAREHAKATMYGADKDNFVAVQGEEYLAPDGITKLRRPAQVMNRKTGQYSDATPPAPAAEPTLIKGKTYVDPKGNKATWDGKQYVPVK